MKSKRMELSGYKFGNYEVIESTGYTDSRGNSIWRCRCRCGNVVELSRAQILGRSHCPKHCGCMTGKEVPIK